ncbi:MAG: heme-dependent oxidative N-demethylase subunit alpha family protein, partial [Bacteroidota bacterium]
MTLTELIATVPAKYLPFHSGKYSVSPGLKSIETDFGNGSADHHIFQIDRDYLRFVQNKQACRRENIAKYYQRKRESSGTLQVINQFIAKQLAAEYPNYFAYQYSNEISQLNNYLRDKTVRWNTDQKLLEESEYQSVFDALADQIPEDLAIWQCSDQDDYISTIHLCAPNHWLPAEKIGKPFSMIHGPVAGMDKLRKNYRPMLSSLLQPKTWVRFAWGLSTDDWLNHHPEPPPQHSKEDWQGRSFNPTNSKLFVRVERQTLTGFPEVNAILFT